jgi:hypothetical protein
MGWDLSQFYSSTQLLTIIWDSTGMTSDYARNRLHLPRSYCISLVAVLFILSQLAAVFTDDVTDLWKASLALGLAYGSLFGLFPTMAFEWFGMCKSYFCGSCLFDMTDLLSCYRFYSPLLRELGLPVPLADFWRQSLFSRFRSQPRRAFTVKHGSKYDKFISGRLTFRSAML